MKIAVVVGSTRPGRFGSQVGDWVMSQAADREATYELLDIAEFNLELLNEETVPGAANRQYENAATRVWSEAVDSFDGFIFVTPEYNHSVPAAMKNAFDLLYPEWAEKSVGFVGYGYDGAVRSVEHWRAIVANAYMFGVRDQVALNLITDVTDGTLTPADFRAQSLAGVFDAVEKSVATHTA